MDLFYALAAASVLAVAMLFAVRLIQLDRHRKRRRRRAARHAAQLRLWNKLFTRHGRPLLTDQRDARNG
ncbi:MAG: hypothetical protein ACTHJR_02475 [Sphingomonas sp.]|uniref:hypothetical protein n=1 Tax=Sphingomonas sp. TaxID=28214 RepID=UPI003F7DA3B6